MCPSYSNMWFKNWAGGWRERRGAWKVNFKISNWKGYCGYRWNNFFEANNSVTKIVLPCFLRNL